MPPPWTWSTVNKQVSKDLHMWALILACRVSRNWRMCFQVITLTGDGWAGSKGCQRRFLTWETKVTLKPRTLPVDAKGSRRRILRTRCRDRGTEEEAKEEEEEEVGSEWKSLEKKEQWLESVPGNLFGECDGTYCQLHKISSPGRRDPGQVGQGGGLSGLCENGKTCPVRVVTSPRWEKRSPAAGSRSWLSASWRSVS